MKELHLPTIVTKLDDAGGGNGIHSNMEHSESDEETFEDALDDSSPGDLLEPNWSLTGQLSLSGDCDMTLEESIHDCQEGLDLYLNNRFTDAKDRVKIRADRSIYHSLSYSTIGFVEAVMTFEQGYIEKALEMNKKAIQVCLKRKRRCTISNSFTKMVKRPNYDLYTEEEVHAELVYAECLLIRALLTFIQDENLVSFIKGGLKIRTCYQTYKECAYMLEHRHWENENIKRQFESGVLMGIGAFNLMISTLPSKFLKLLEFVGFSGNRDIGLQKLDEGWRLENGLRGPLCAIMLLVYHSIITYWMGKCSGDLEYSDVCIQPLLKKYPKGTIILFLAGRLEEVKSNTEKAISRLRESVKSQDLWRQFHHLCYWELMWCHSFLCEWREAWHYADSLFQESRWSKTVYAYQKLAFMAMIKNELTPEETEEMIGMAKECPRHKQRIAGKSIPLEKFAIKKSNRFLAQGNRLVLPALELMYVWNCFNIIGKRLSLLDSVYTLVERELKRIPEEKDTTFYYDNYCLLLLLKGMCLRYMKMPLLAEQSFREVIRYEKMLQEDQYLVPNALVEIGMMQMDTGNSVEAIRTLEEARSTYKGYSLEARIHFKIHAAITEIRSGKLSQPPTPSPNEPPSPSEFIINPANGTTNNNVTPVPRPPPRRVKPPAPQPPVKNGTPPQPLENSDNSRNITQL